MSNMLALSWLLWAFIRKSYGVDVEGYNTD
jgi:hypothetical protein